jgi:alkylation response protein AidB-like acyl-CoA dehydrogenase
MKDRWSFGRPLVSYQALKHRIADILLFIESAKGCAEAAADASGHDAPDAPTAASVAKAYAHAKAVHVLGECVQFNGGIGVTWEHDIHLYERRAAVNNAVYGTPQQHYERICTLLDV